MSKNKEPELTDAPTKAWQKFFLIAKELNDIPVSQWKINHIIHYWCEKYKAQYKVSYTFKSFAQPPSSCYEVYRVKSIAQNISSNPTIIKDYIDWIFKEKIILKKKRITSLAILCDANYINEYKAKFLTMTTKPIDRSTNIPPNFAAIIQTYGYKFSTYGELAFLKKSIDAGNDEQKYKDVLNELARSGMDLSALDRVKVMFKNTFTELSYFQYKGYRNATSSICPHTIEDSEFEVTIFPRDKKLDNGVTLIKSFVEEFVWVYEQKQQNVAANLVLLEKWLRSKFLPTHSSIITFNRLMSKKYIQYGSDLEKYRVLL